MELNLDNLSDFDTSEEIDFAVESLLDIRWGSSTYSKGIEYLVHWQGYGEEDETWEVEENLNMLNMNLDQMMKAFADKRAQLLQEHGAGTEDDADSPHSDSESSDDSYVSR